MSIVLFFSIFRNDRLKSLLQQHYHQLTYDQPAQRNQSELVYSSSASFTELAAFPGAMSDDSYDSCSGDETLQVSQTAQSHMTNSHYYSGVGIRNAIDKHQYKTVWPPDSKDLTLKDFEKF